ncbi:threonylcarbamoyl-AMP synthase [Parashewanella spongiae]|nr:L-threonylcarbamoyladenylate synthase [Parashewanella spongiae]MCL1079292.1 threonylcarbamoyl-AMP synthase [Parashewanella spongiae]
MNQKLQPQQAIPVIQSGGIIAYPTEAVYGLGCDPDNLAALNRLLILKDRPWQKGLIIVASDWEQLTDYVDFAKMTDEQMTEAKSKWPGPVTQVMPAKASVSSKLKGSFNTIAVRISAHSIVQQLCQSLGKPLVSTSANLAGEPPALSIEQIEHVFEHQLDAIILGELGNQNQPSRIIDVLTGQVLR